MSDVVKQLEKLAWLEVFHQIQDDSARRILERLIRRGIKRTVVKKDVTESGDNSNVSQHEGQMGSNTQTRI